MLYKKRSRVAHFPAWQSYSTHIIFVICATSGVLYLLAHEFDISPLPIENHSILIAHGAASYFFAMLFGAVMPIHIKAGWKSKRNKISGSLMVSVMSLLLISGIFLYYGADTREVALWVHWVIGCGLVLLFPFHFIAGRRANYLALKYPNKIRPAGDKTQ
jgi:hypothetical protein